MYDYEWKSLIDDSMSNEELKNIIQDEFNSDGGSYDVVDVNACGYLVYVQFRQKNTEALSMDSRYEYGDSYNDYLENSALEVNDMIELYDHEDFITGEEIDTETLEGSLDFHYVNAHGFSYTEVPGVIQFVRSMNDEEWTFIDDHTIYVDFGTVLIFYN